MPTTTHVLFDFFGTLVRYSPSRVGQGYRRSHALLLELGARLEYGDFLERWDAIWDEFELRAEQSLDEYSMDTVCETFLERVLSQRPTAEAPSLLRDTYLEEWSAGVSYLPGVAELLAELAERFTLALVTNTHHPGLVHEHLGAAGLAPYFAEVITSVEHGKRKPSVCIFERALDRTSGRADRAVYVGDSFSADYQGATAAGLRCLLLDPEGRHAVAPRDRLSDVLETGERLDS